MSQSSDDVFPGAMSIATSVGVVHHLIPALRQLRGAIEAKAYLGPDRAPGSPN